MSTSADRRWAFSFWLRTGRWVLPPQSDLLELKFNPWHDPENGRFTYASTGRYFGKHGGDFQGGSGSFGGAGAGGTWSESKLRRSAPKQPPVLDTHGTTGSLRRRSVSVETIKRPERTTTTRDFERVVRNGYEFQIDDRKRTRRVSGAIALGDQGRSRTAQALANGEDRRPNDDGGHYIARRFRGPREAFNHFAQNANFNRGGYRALEDQWARAKKNGKSVSVRIVPVYNGASLRPSTINIWFSIDGSVESVRFLNERKETIRGRR